MELSKKYLDLVDEAKRIINEISVEDVYEMIMRNSPFKFIDIREQNEWMEKRIVKATYIGKGIIEREIEGEVPDEKTLIVLYCGGGYRSALSAENLQKMGYSNIYSMKGGITEWIEKNFPIDERRIDL